jgi:hypothetical protein
MRQITSARPVFAHGCWHNTQEDADAARYVIRYKTQQTLPDYGPYTLTWDTYETAGEAAAAFVALIRHEIEPDPAVIAEDLVLGVTFEARREPCENENVIVSPL